MHTSTRLRAKSARAVFIALAIVGTAAAQSKIEIESVISSVRGTTIQLFDGLLSVEARGAVIEVEDDAFTNISDLKPGSAVTISAVVDPDGTIRATRVEVDDDGDDEMEITGVVETVDEAAQTFTIGRLGIAWDGRTKFKGFSVPKAGLFVEASVATSGGRIVAAKLEREEPDD